MHNMLPVKEAIRLWLFSSFSSHMNYMSRMSSIQKHHFKSGPIEILSGEWKKVQKRPPQWWIRIDVPYKRKPSSLQYHWLFIPRLISFCACDKQLREVHEVGQLLQLDENQSDLRWTAEYAVNIDLVTFSLHPWLICRQAKTVHQSILWTRCCVNFLVHQLPPCKDMAMYYSRTSETTEYGVSRELK